MGAGMRLIIAVVALIVLGSIVSAIAVLVGGSSVKIGGELRCEGVGAVIINIAGEDYAVDPIAGWQYPPVQRVWNDAAYPEVDIDRILARGLTLCDY
jgi:hypothetical protein